MIDIDNQSELNIPINTLEKIAASLSTKEIELIITDNAHIQEINAHNRGIDQPTDVLSFPFEDIPMGPLGSIVVSADYVKHIASELHHSEENELCLLFIHGLLHLLGYDHETDNGEMREKESELIRLFDLPSSLIIRTEG